VPKWQGLSRGLESLETVFWAIYAHGRRRMLEMAESGKLAGKSPETISLYYGYFGSYISFLPLLTEK
jgi:hypothetical protein